MVNETDRELLVWAAKAAGVLTKSWYTNEAYINGLLTGWNPLSDNGQSFELAVKLHLLYGINTDILNHYLALELPSDDSLAATRRAIVKAAAEIGRNMK